MNWKKYLQFAPYVLIIIANFIYLYFHGFGPLKYHPKLILYNILFFIIIGAIIMIKVNLLLHSWFVKQQGDVKQKTKKVIRTVLAKLEFVKSIFTIGNQRMMIKIFLYVQLWIFLRRYIPAMLLTIFVGTYFQYKGFLEERFKEQFKKMGEMFQQMLREVMKKVPRYEKVRVE